LENNEKYYSRHVVSAVQVDILIRLRPDSDRKVSGKSAKTFGLKSFLIGKKVADHEEEKGKKVLRVKF
jgi:hypothetical protein